MRKKSHRSSDIVKSALATATKAHKGQMRSSGEPFIEHPKAVAKILEDINADKETIAAALLHDTIEDTRLEIEDIERMFGKTVRDLVEGVTKIEKIEMMKTDERNMQSIRKMFRAMGRDPRVLFIKIADRLHNMRTIDAFPLQKQIRIARETQDIYCPLSNLLGIRAWHEELSDHCFRILDPVEYELVQRKFLQTKKEQLVSLEKWTSHFSSFLKQHKVRISQVALHRRHFRAVRTESVEQENVLQHIESFHLLYVIVPNTFNCYDCLGIVHQFASPLSGSMDDYIALPKVNGYQALHTHVLTPSGNPLTVIIQTESMHQHGNLGMATMFLSDKAKHPFKSLPNWIEALLTVDEREQDLHTFFLRLQSEIFQERNHVQVIIKKRKKAIDLPANASVLDLAFYASKEIGSSTSSAKINGKPVNSKHLVHDGDAVELVTAAKRSPRSAQDLYSIHTTLAHKHLLRHLSELPRGQRIRQGEELLRNALNFTIDPFFGVHWQKDIHKRIEVNNEILQKIGSGLIDAFLFLEEHGKPQEFFLLDPSCLHIPRGILPTTQMRFVLRTTIENLQKGNIVGVQAGPDVIDVVATETVKRSQQKIFSKEIVPLQIRPEQVQFPFHFALKWTFPPERNPLKDIAALENFLDTPVHLLRFEPTSITLGFRTDRLRTLQIAYKYLYSLSHVLELFRITP